MTGIPAPRVDGDLHAITIALCSRLDDRDVSPLTTGPFWDLYERLGGDLRAAASDEDPAVRDLAGRSMAAALHAADLESQGIGVLTPFSAGYPDRFLTRLGSAAPPILYVAGDRNLLTASDRSRLAIVGSRDASQEAADMAREASEEAVRRGWLVVSGGARGIDSIALNTAVERGSPVTALLTEGVRQALKKGALRRLVADGQAMLVSPVHPDMGFTVGNAMARNKLIYALSDATFVADVVEGEGGTWAGAKEALTRQYGHVRVNARAAGAEALAELGAVSVETTAGIFAPTDALPVEVVDQPAQAELFGLMDQEPPATSDPWPA